MKQNYSKPTISTSSVLSWCIDSGLRKPGQNLNDFDEDDETALEKAIRCGFVKASEVKLLIDAGSDPNICYISEKDPIDESGVYPLYWALRSCNQYLEKEERKESLEVVRVLLAMGADPSLFLPYHNTSILEGAISDYETNRVMFRYNAELLRFWDESDKSVKSNIDILQILAEKYNLPTVEHFYLALEKFNK